MVTAVKICGITRHDDAQAAARLGAQAVGFVFCAKSPRNVAADRASQIARALPPFVMTVGLFVNPAAGEVESVLKTVALDLLQFHGE
ncbi:MAG TPA: N-(5'-phosphoribosyl)anthranilate isomerase, partial [Burkholderiales bacterium]|nr:N-(5'-phosphoribosyl)anthranilate isomerase [Burkholderiales bacterium]